MIILNKKPFYLGIGITCLMIVLHLLPDSGGGGGPTGSGNMLSNLSFLEELLTLIPGVLLISYGIFPSSILGRIGRAMYDLYAWVRRENKK